MLHFIRFSFYFERNSKGMKIKQLLIIVLVGTLTSCGNGSSHDKELLSKAHEKQKEVIALLGELEERISNSEFSAKDSLLSVIEEHEENVFEIPGYHLELPGHEGHDHSHAEVELTDQEIYDVQIEMLKELKGLQQFIEAQ